MKIKRENIRTCGITIAVTCILFTVIIAIFIAFSNTSSMIYGADYTDFSATFHDKEPAFNVRAFGQEYTVDYSELAAHVNEGAQKYFPWIPREMRAGMQIFQLIRDFFSNA